MPQLGFEPTTKKVKQSARGQKHNSLYSLQIVNFRYMRPSCPKNRQFSGHFGICVISVTQCDLSEKLI